METRGISIGIATLGDARKSIKRDTLSYGVIELARRYLAIYKEDSFVETVSKNLSLD